MWSRVAETELKALKWIAARRRWWLTAPLWLVTWSGAAGVWVAVALGLYLALRQDVELVPQQQTFLMAMRAVLVPLAVGTVIKIATRRRRPCHPDHGVPAAVWAPGPTASFPSTHASTSVALAALLLVVHHPLALVASVWAALVCASRIYLGVHFISDVVAGALLGASLGLAPNLVGL